MKKLGIIHTSAVSLDALKKLCNEILEDVEVINIIDDSLLEEVKNNKGITSAIISRMCTYVQNLNQLNVDLILNQCSSVGEAFDIAKKCSDKKTLKIDLPMMEKAVSLGSNIAVVATVESTMKPSCNLLKNTAKKMQKEIHVDEYLVKDALDILMKEKNQEKHNSLVMDAINKACKNNDVIVLAQGSMIALLPYLNEVEKPVLTSPRMAIERIKEML